MKNFYSCCLQAVGHRGIGVLIRAQDRMPQRLHQQGSIPHARATDAHEVNPHTFKK